MPKLVIAVALLALIALASTMTYTGYLVVGVLAGYLDTARIWAGLLLAVIFARLPQIRDGKLRTIGLLPKPARRPVMLSLLAVCLISFVHRGEIPSALFVTFAATFILAYPRMRRAVLGRMLAPFAAASTNRNRPNNTDDTVIDVEFREKKD